MGGRTAKRGLAAVCAVAGVAAPAAAQAAEEPRYSAEIRRTAHGIPHIKADDLGSAAYGYAYAFAEDNLCTIADSYVTVSADRSRFFGPDKSYVFQGNGQRVNNLNSDFFFQRIIDDRVVEDLLEQPPPHGPLNGLQEAVKGYVAGYNDYLADVGVENLPDPRCRGQEWARPITEMDVWRRFYQLILLASQGVAIDGIAEAQPPGPGLIPEARLDPEAFAQGLKDAGLPTGALGSNAYGLGSEATDNGRGMVLANPHFPWQGSERFYQAQITVPGELDVAGMSLYGVPLALIGHTRNMAWSHTVSTAFRFTLYEETLVPGSATTYIHDGQPRAMERDTVTVDLGGETRSRTLYSTHHGPVLTSLVGLPLPWTQGHAFTMRDANAANFRAINHFFETNKAQSVRELDAILREYQGIPWVNTIAADSSGEAYYADLSVVPHVTDEKALECGTALGQATFQAVRLPSLDGSRSACEWGSDHDAVVDGIFGPSNLPSLFRDDYVTNSNDSYWLSNPEEPIEGYDRIIGDERTARSLRTRSGLVMIEEQLADGGEIALTELQEMVFANRQHAGELFRDDLVEMCRQTPVLADSDGELVDVSEACDVLAAWDLRDDLDSNGAILFRRFVGRALGAAGGPYRVPFDAEDPVHTPRGLNTAHPQVRTALADAVDELRDDDIPLDAPLRGFQFEPRGDERIPIHGGPGSLGVFNAINVSYVPGVGYPDVPHGSSHVAATQFTGGDCPVEARTILTYSQSENPESPYFADQTRLFSRKEWVTERFCEADILSDPALTSRVVEGG